MLRAHHSYQKKNPTPIKKEVVVEKREPIQLLSIDGYIEVGSPKELQKTSKVKKTIPHAVAVKFLENIHEVDGVQLYMLTNENLSGIVGLKIKDFGQFDITDNTPASKGYDVYQFSHVNMAGVPPVGMKPNQIKKLVGSSHYYTIKMKGHDVMIRFVIESVGVNKPRKGLSTIKKVDGIIVKEF